MLFKAIACHIAINFISGYSVVGYVRCGNGKIQNLICTNSTRRYIGCAYAAISNFIGSNSISGKFCIANSTTRYLHNIRCDFERSAVYFNVHCPSPSVCPQALTSQLSNVCFKVIAIDSQTVTCIYIQGTSRTIWAQAGPSHISIDFGSGDSVVCNFCSSDILIGYIGGLHPPIQNLITCDSICCNFVSRYRICRQLQIGTCGCVGKGGITDNGLG